jgi:hypothetical protein
MAYVQLQQQTDMTNLVAWEGQTPQVEGLGVEGGLYIH